jgi:hypothetical protein
MHSRYLVIFPAAALVLACSGGDDASLATDSALARDLTLAAGDSTLPELRDVPTTPPPTRATAPDRPQTTPRRAPTPPPRREPAPTVTPPPPPPVTAAPAPAPAPRKLIAAGTTMAFTVGSRVCTTSQIGDKFVATLTETVTGSDGARIPAGTRAVVEVASVSQGSNNKDAELTFRVWSIATDDGTVKPVGEAMPLDTLERVRAEQRGSDAKKVAGGAIAGAIIGQIIGKDTKGTVIGAAAGAAAGTAAAMATAKYEGCLPSGGRIQLALAEPLEVK